MTSAQASQLIQASQHIQTVLGCSVSGIVASPSAQSSLNSTQKQQHLQTPATLPSLMQPRSTYTYQNRYPSQYPYLFQTPQSQPSSQNLRSQMPIANAGIPQIVYENSKVTLDGRTSHPADGGMIVGYQWTQLPTGVPVILTGANTADSNFYCPFGTFGYSIGI